MTLASGLALVLATFVLLMGTVMTVAFRARRAGTASSDAQVLTVIFGSIIGGMLLTLVTAVLVFF